MLYDRRILRAVAQTKGDATSADMARRLRISTAAAWRLWTGKCGPSARIAALVKAEYDLDTADLLRRGA